MIFSTTENINIPTKINAGAVAALGTICIKGEKNIANINKSPMITAVKPVLPPDSTPVILSIYAPTVLTPKILPAVEPSASAINAFLALNILPFSSTKPARCATPINVPIVSNTAIKSIVNTAIKKFEFNIFEKSI